MGGGQQLVVEQNSVTGQVADAEQQVVAEWLEQTVDDEAPLWGGMKLSSVEYAELVVSPVYSYSMDGTPSE